jgi:hypothetical protein
MLPRAIGVGRRCSGWAVKGWNPEDDFNVAVADFDPAHESADNGLYGGPIEILETLGHLGREVFQTTDHERKVALDLDHFDRGLVPLPQLG